MYRRSLLLTLLFASGVIVIGAAIPSAADVGRGYFNGTTPFTNGGPPCKTCHHINVLNVTGGSVGPDLSSALNFTKFGGDVAKLKQFLSAPDTPTMSSIWGNAPLTSSEIDALSALIQYASTVSGQMPGPPIAATPSATYYEFFATSTLAGLGLGLILYFHEIRKTHI